MGSFCRSLSGQDRTDRAVPLEYLSSVSKLISRARIIEEMDQPTRQPNSIVTAWSMAGLALLIMDKRA